MKKSVFIAGAGIAVMLTMSGCNLFQKNVKTEATLPMDRETVKVDTNSRAFRSKDLEKGLIKGDWAIETVMGKKAKGEVAPYLKFEPKENMVYGNNGCNYINGGYKYSSADSTLTFSNIVTTLKSCGPTDITETEINTALDRTRYYTWDLKDSQHRLYFYDEHHSPLMTLMHQSFNFLNGPWKVVKVNGEDMNSTDMNLVFDIDEMKVHGNTGCNIINGSLETNPETANAISFQQMATTRMTCQDISKEMSLLVALEEAVYVRPVSKDRVQFLNGQGKAVMELTRMDKMPE